MSTATILAAAATIGGFIGGVIGAAITAYFTERAKNLAIKSDIGKITQEIESVKAVFTREIEDQRATNQLRTACIEKRLAAHQEAYTLWLKLVSAVHSDNVGGLVAECQQWWNDHCLYLAEVPRQKFLEAFRAAHIHSDLLRNRGTDSKIAAQVGQNWERIMALGPAVERAVGLPPINDVVEAHPDRGG